MEYCEFLLQKEGDRAWLPLESPSVEVLEGRYRLIARSSYPDAAVEIRVGYQPDGAIGGTSQRTQSRSAQTNVNGLVVVIPFTVLRPGLWEFSCRQSVGEEADPTTTGPAWRYAVTLQVLAVEAEDWVDVEPQPATDALAQESNGSEVASRSPDEFSPSHGVNGAEGAVEEVMPELVAEANAANGLAEAIAPKIPQATELEPIASEIASGIASEVAPEITPESTPKNTPEITPAIAPEPASAKPPSIPLPALPPTEPFTPPIERLIQVEDDRLLRIADRLLQQMVEPAEPDPMETIDPLVAASQLPPLHLRLDRTTYITAWGDQLVLQGSLDWAEPTKAPMLAQLPPTLEWRVTLRDPNSQRVLVRLRQPIAGSRWSRPSDRPLPGQFTCTVELPLEASTFLMLGELALYPHSLPSAEPLTSQAFAVAADADALLRAIEPDFRPEDCTEDDRAPAALPHESLPFRPNAQAPAKKSLDLKLLNFVQPAKAPMLPSMSPSMSPSMDSAPSMPEVAPAPIAGVELPEAAILQGLPPAAPIPTANGPAPWAIDPLPSEPSPFDALPKGHRFWSRLTALADDQDLRAWMRARGEGVAPAPEPPDPDADWTAGEVLVDDLLPLQNGSNGWPVQASPPPPPPADATLPPTMPIPQPTIELLTHPLVAETTATLRLRVTEVPSRLCIKVWTSDRQTRQILEPPRWLLELPPNGLGELETRVTLTVPALVAELSIEAVVMELATHRESRKAVIVAPVLPPEAHPDRPTLDPLAINNLFEALSPSRWD
ncbi:hypothetical protein H6G52_00705 [Limnothrix sp. FACHB-881]|uniref:hypothetical protein n=1 Tax=Limnothrix sp. FACHB-881 TaxID=2692819 RepID=UPI001688AF3A|nr:hypothetical protein [Limnothrix sp. FACHB-881]MBD2633868.1 hypothetical protein [Limnothrix sp. FACHB-881]